MRNVSTAAIRAIWDRLCDPSPPSRGLRSYFTRRAAEAESGWVGMSYIGDLLFHLDLRIDESELLGLARISKEFVYYKPNRRDRRCSGFEHIRATDFAALLILLEKLGLPVDPEQLVALLLPEVKRNKLITSSQLGILWYGEERGKCDFELRGGEANVPLSESARIATPTGYTARLYHDPEWQAVQLNVVGPRWRPGHDGL
jgi:hypothetical protein